MVRMSILARGGAEFMEQRDTQLLNSVTKKSGQLPPDRMVVELRIKWSVWIGLPSPGGRVHTYMATTIDIGRNHIANKTYNFSTTP